MIRLKTLYFDCFSGAAGDMILGALIDAGVPVDEIRRALGSLAIAPDTIWTERVMRAGISATKFCVRGEDHGHEHGTTGGEHRGRHTHTHGEAHEHERDHRHHHDHDGGHHRDHGHGDH